MKPLRHLALATLLVLAGARSKAAAPLAVEPIGPPGGSTQGAAVSADGKTVYVGTQFAGSFRSDDQGAHWSRLPGSPPGTLAQLAVDAGEARTVYAATSAGLFQSRDAGATWHGLNDRIPGVNGCNPATQSCGRAALVIADPLHPDAVLASFEDSDLLVRSTDSGATWSRSASGLAGLFIHRLAAGAQPGTFYAATDHGVRASHDGGATWSASGLKPYNVIRVAVDAGSEEGAYAISTGYDRHGGAYQEAWQRERRTSDFTPPDSASTLPVRAIFAFAADPLAPGVAFAAAFDGVYRTLDRGTTWTKADERQVVGILPASGAAGTLFAQAGPDEGTPLLLSTDDGASWKPVAPGVGAHAARRIVLDPARPRTLFVETARDALRRSDDGGASWRRIFAPSPYPENNGADFALDPFDSSRLILVDPVGIYQSTDRGAHWTLRRSGFVQTVAGDPAQRGTFYAFSFNNGLLRSRDGGQTWTATGALSQSWHYALLVQAKRGRPSTLYAGAFAFDDSVTRLWRSLDGGDSWTPLLRLSRPEAAITDIVGVPGEPNQLFVSFANRPQLLEPFTTGGVYRTRDGGATWQLARLDAERSPALAVVLDPADSAHLFAGTTRGRIFESRDGGASWSLLPAPLPAADVNDLQIDPGHPGILYAALEGASVFRLALER